jgi:hypothetical protein
MSSMIFTGIGPIAVMVINNAKLFSSFYTLHSGIAFLSVIAVFLVTIIHRHLHLLHVEQTENG